MNENIILKRVVMTFGLTLSLGISLVFAKDRPLKSKDVPISIRNDKEQGIKPVSTSIVTESAVQIELDYALASLQGKLANLAIPMDNMENVELAVSEENSSDRGKASSMFSYLDQNPEKVKSFISFEDLVTLPIGLKQSLNDNTEVALGIYSVEYTPTGARLTVFIRVKMKVSDPSKERVLLFGSDAVSFTRSGGLGAGGSFKVALLGDFPIPMNNWTVVLKGVSSMGNIDSSPTSVTFNCDKFSGASLGLDIVFPRNVLIPFQETERVALDGRVKFSASATVTDGFNDIYAVVNSPMAFAAASFPRFGFKVGNVRLDLSDFKGGNEPGLFPDSYDGPDKGDTRWRGLLIGQFSVLLAKEFNNKDASALTGTKLIIDRSGLTGSLSYSNSINPLQCDAQKWPLSISSFSLAFVQSKLVAGGFGGTIRTPLNTDIKDPKSALIYSALISNTGEYAFTIDVENGDYPINCWRAKAKINKGSWLDLVVKNNKFYPSASLNGTLELAANTNTITEGAPESNGTVSLKGIIFNDLQLAVNEAGKFNFSIGEFKYVGTTDSRLARFPISITRFENIRNATGMGEDDLWFGFGFRVSLAGDRFAGATDLLIKTHYDELLGKFVLGSKNDKNKFVEVKKLYIKGSTNFMDAEGNVDFFENATELSNTYSNLIKGTLPQSKGFSGSLNLVLKKPFKVGVELNALFGFDNVDNYSFGFFSAFVGDTEASLRGVEQNADGTEKAVADSKYRFTKPNGGFVIPTGIADLGINGLGLGVYFNMKPSLEGTLVKYKVNKDVPFGLKLMLGVQNNALPGTSSYVEPTFKGRLNVDFALDRKYGINSIALSGIGTFASNLTGGNSSAQMMEGLSKSLKDSTTTALMNMNPKQHDQAALIAQSKSQNQNVPISNNGDIVVAMGVLFDFPKKIFHAEAEVYMNIKNPATGETTLRGIGMNNLAGRAVIHFEKSNTYVHIGKQDILNRVGIRYRNNFEFGAYLMMGKGIGPIPLPPAEVVSFFPSLRTRLNGSNSATGMGEVLAGNGFAVGAHIKANIDSKGWLGYIKGYGVGGMDILLIKPCADGLSGDMQIYGVAQVEAGLGKKQLFNGGVGFFLKGTGFKPFQVGGDVCITYGKNNKQLCLTSKVSETPANCN